MARWISSASFFRSAGLIDRSYCSNLASSDLMQGRSRELKPPHLTWASYQNDQLPAILMPWKMICTPGHSLIPPCSRWKKTPRSMVCIRARMQTMERGVFFQRLQGGIKEWPGVQIIFHGIRIAGSWSFWYEAHVKCGGFNSRDRPCIRSEE